VEPSHGLVAAGGSVLLNLVALADAVGSFESIVQAAIRGHSACQFKANGKVFVCSKFYFTHAATSDSFSVQCYL
jgi:hypothetical protein